MFKYIFEGLEMRYAKELKLVRIEGCVGLMLRSLKMLTAGPRTVSQ
jgi:hypothetical protein